MDAAYLCFVVATLFIIFPSMITAHAKSKEKSNECDLVVLGCKCSKGWKTVDCKPANPKLTSVPNLIPLEVETLKLSDNSIKTLSNANLDLPNLKKFEMKNNDLTRITRSAFIKLPNLERLDLTGNIITFVAPDAFRNNPNLYEIKLEANPLYCECDMFKFKEWAAQNSVTLSKAKCANKLWKNLNEMSANEFGNCQVAVPATVKPAAVTTTSTTTIAVTDIPGYTHRFGDCPGKYIKLVPGSIDKCRRECDEVTDCRSFLWNFLGSSSYCFLKRGSCPQLTQVHIKNYHFFTKIEKTCPKDFTITLKGNFTWPETASGQIASVMCEYQPPGEKKMALLARRECSLRESLEAYWQAPDLSECRYTNWLTAKLQDLAEEAITKNNVISMTARLAEISTNVTNFSYVDVALTSDTIDNVLKSDTAFTSAGVQKETAVNLAKTVGNMMDVSADTMLAAEEIEGNTVTRLVEQVETISKYLELFGLPTQTIVQPNLAFGVVNSNQASSGDVSIVLNHMALQEALTTDKVIIQVGGSVNVSEADTFLTIPQDIALKFKNEKMSFSLYGKDTFFRAMNRKTQNAKPPRATTNSRVVAANIGDQEIQNLSTPIVLHFDYVSKTGYSNPQCVFWDFDLAGWSGEGCRVVTSHSDGASCECDHLTSFALLMDLTGDVAGLDATQLLVQSVLTYIGCILSLLALLLTVFTHFFFHEELLRDNPSRILMNLCFSIIATNVIFICGSHHMLDDAGCKVIAVFLHYTILASFCWMTVEAFYMYLALIKVFQPYWSKLILKLAIFGWGFPLIPIAITIGINRDNYGLQGMCWLRPIPLFASFVAPACLMLVVNFVIFTMVVWKLYGKKQGTILTKTDKKSTSTQLRGAASVAVLLGLTWTFGLLNIEGAALVFSYLFIVCNTLQGVFIFMFFCLWKKQARNAWAKKCGCKFLRQDRYKSSSGTGNGSSGTGTGSTGYSKDSNSKQGKTISDASLTSGDLSGNEFVTLNHKNVKETIVLKPASQRNDNGPAVFQKC
ncbi:adhesion G-protein coupled receptor G6-like [Lineus longissimus]|uniref:adhesion G-protein coupled receptor G6-like n=1 Tax=Lineus longissimus TaxID=88925 RepID=UPI00315D3F8E